MIILSNKQYNAELNKVFLEGYERGKEEGKRENLYARVTPNELRRLLGLDELKGEDDD